MSKKIGVITEQGFPAGQFGFDPLKKPDRKKILEQAEKEKNKTNK